MNLKHFLSFFAHPPQEFTALTGQSDRMPAAVSTAQPDKVPYVDSPEEKEYFLQIKTELMGQLSALHNAAIVSETDLEGNITFANDVFCRLSGYTLEELFGQNHRILKSGEHSDAIYADLWKTISSGNAWKGEITNRAKDGSFYYVYSVITPVIDVDTGKPVKYISVRTDVTFQKKQEAILLERSREINHLNEKLADTLAVLEERYDEKSNDLSESVSYSKRIQTALLPDTDQIRQLLPQNFECEILFLPRDEVSGDFYQICKRGNRVVFAVGDGTGHGVPGAFLSILGLIALRNLAQERGVTEPAHLLDETDEALRQILKQKTVDSVNGIKDSIDMAVCTLIPGKNELTYASARLKSYLTDENGNVNELPADRRPVGGTETDSAAFNSVSLRLQPGDTLYLLSDGFISQLGETGREERTKKFGSQALKELLTDLSRISDLKARIEKMKQILTQWQGTAKQTDDILVAALRYRPFED